MHPVLFELFGVPVRSFGVMMAAGFLVAAWIMRHRMEEEGLDPDLWGVMLLSVLVGSVIAARLYFAVDTALRTDARLPDLLALRGGMTWYGGLVGGFLGAALATWWAGIRLKTFADSACIGIAVGQAIGRVGCLLAGDDYGRPTDLPIGMAFPDGSPPTLDRVHPTQIYEMLWLLGAAAFLWRRRRASPFLCGEYLALHGAGRIAVEQLRTNPELALGLTQAQWFGIGLIAFSAITWTRYRRLARAGGAPPQRLQP